MSRPPVDPHLDDLPAMQRLGDDLGAAFQRAEAGEQRRTARRRRTRRLAVALAAALVLVPGAVATRSIWAPTSNDADPSRPRSERSPVVIAKDPHWRLSVYDTAQGTCVQLFVVGGPANQGVGCPSIVRPGRLAVAFAGTDTGPGYVYGIVPRRTARVSVHNGAAPVVQAPVGRPGSEELRRGGLRDDFRYFVVPVAGGLDPGRLSVVATDGAGRTVGRFGAR
jgi:hypothetical protein